MFEKARVRGSIVAALGISCAVLILPGLAATHAHAQTLTTLCSFNGSNGQTPRSQLDAHRLDALRDDRTRRGERRRHGVQHRHQRRQSHDPLLVQRQQWDESLRRFDAQRLDALRDDRRGGANGDGTVFSIATSGGNPTTLCSFNGSNGHISPCGLDAHRLDALRDDRGGRGVTTTARFSASPPAAAAPRPSARSTAAMVIAPLPV